MENRKRGIESDEDVSRKRRKFGTNLTNLEQNLNIEKNTSVKSSISINRITKKSADDNCSIIYTYNEVILYKITLKNQIKKKIFKKNTSATDLNLILKNEPIEVYENEPIDFKNLDQYIEGFIYRRLFDEQTNQSKEIYVDSK